MSGTRTSAVEEDITLYQSTAAPPVELAEITDQDGTAINCSGMTLRFIVWSLYTKQGVFEIDGADVVVSGDDNSIVTVTYAIADTALADTYAYELWDDDSERLLAFGACNIVRAVKDMP